MNDNFPPWNGTIKYKRNYRRPTLRDFHCTVGTQFLKRFSCRLPWHLCDLAERGLWRRGDHWGFLSNKFTVGQVLLRGLHALSDQMLLQSLCSALSDQMLLQSLLSTVRPDASAASAQHCPTRCFCRVSAQHCPTRCFCSLCSALSDQMLLQLLLSTVRPDASAASPWVWWGGGRNPRVAGVSASSCTAASPPGSRT